MFNSLCACLGMVFSTPSTVGAFAVPSTIGIVPARDAARLDPVDALAPE